MKGFSKAIVAGNITRDPELRALPSGTSVCSFSIAVSRSFRGQDGQTRDEVSYLDCTAWGKQGEIIAQYMKKGNAILASGRLVQRSWEDKNGGGKRSRVEINVDDFSFIGGGNGGNGGSYGGGATMAAPATTAADAMASGDVLDEIPDEVDLSGMPF